MQVKEMLLSIPILFFILWVYSGPLPTDRINRLCEPVNWVGNIATSTTAVSSESHTAVAVKWSDKLNYSCRYLVWRLFYQDDYNKAISSGTLPKGKPAGVTVSTPKTTDGEEVNGDRAKAPKKGPPASPPASAPAPAPASSTE